MLREEAEREAERRNREDADRDRFEFYPFDESAGIAPDAWDVAARLRQGPRTDRPATAAAASGAGRRDAPAYEEAPAAYDAPVHDAPTYDAPVHDAPAYGAPAYREPGYDDPVYDEPAYGDAVYAPEPYDEAVDGPRARRRPRLRAPRRRAREDVEDDRPGLFVRTIGAVVVLVGVVWIAIVVALALVLRPEDSTSFAVYIAAAILGLLAIGLGVAIRRS